MATLEELSVGTKVMVYNTPDSKMEGEVVVINDPESMPGKWIGVRLTNHHPLAHSCDGACEDGHGWYTRPEYVAALPSA